MSVRQATQAFVVASHSGRAVVVQSLLVRHPATQVPPRHTGIPAAVQSLFAAHSTQRLVVASHLDVLPRQALESLAVHCTQVCEVASQTGALVEHAPAPVVVPTMHPTQAPVLGSHTVPPPNPGPPPQRAPPSTAHEA